MDDDLAFGTSVWATSEPIPSESGLPGINPNPFVGDAISDEPQFTVLDDFADSTTTKDVLAEDDDFGDFGDFREAVELDDSAATLLAHADDFRIGGSSSHSWRPVLLNPFPSRSELEITINETLSPIWNHEDIKDVTTDDPIREAEGIAQILMRPSRYALTEFLSLLAIYIIFPSREMYKKLLQTPPPTKPPNWTRSRIRRQHLIALGVPVNLDEMLPRANGKPLPPLEIHTRPSSAPPGNRNHHASSSRDGTPRPGEQGLFAQFGPKPELEMARINKLLQLNTGKPNQRFLRK